MLQVIKILNYTLKSPQTHSLYRAAILMSMFWVCNYLTFSGYTPAIYKMQSFLAIQCSKYEGVKLRRRFKAKHFHLSIIFRFTFTFSLQTCMLTRKAPAFSGKKIFTSTAHLRDHRSPLFLGSLMNH